MAAGVSPQTVPGASRSKPSPVGPDRRARPLHFSRRRLYSRNANRRAAEAAKGRKAGTMEFFGAGKSWGAHALSRVVFGALAKDLRFPSRAEEFSQFEMEE